MLELYRQNQATGKPIIKMWLVIGEQETDLLLVSASQTTIIAHVADRTHARVVGDVAAANVTRRGVDGAKQNRTAKKKSKTFFTVAATIGQSARGGKRGSQPFRTNRGAVVPADLQQAGRGR